MPAPRTQRPRPRRPQTVREVRVRILTTPQALPRHHHELGNPERHDRPRTGRMVLHSRPCSIRQFNASTATPAATRPTLVDQVNAADANNPSPAASSNSDRAAPNACTSLCRRVTGQPPALPATAPLR